MRQHENGAAATRQQVAAVDVGGTSIKGALVDAELRVVEEVRRTTPRDGGPAEVVDAIAAVIGDLIAVAPSRPAAVGVAVPGIVDEETGMARYSANLGWRDLPLAAILADRIGLPVALGHDVRAGALAEHRMGAGRGATGILFLPLGFGVAGAIVADGRMIRSGGHAGEIGHLVVEPGGERCGCGQLGCLETVASAASIGRRYAARAGLPAPIGAQEVVDRVRRADAVAVAVWTEAIDALAGAITTVIAVVAPSVVVVGGGLSLAGDLLLEPLRVAVEKRRTFLPLPRIVPAELGDRAGTLGAAVLALDLVASSPSATIGAR